MRCLIIGHYDSFSWDLADDVAQTFGCTPLVVRNDKSCWREIRSLDAFGCILVSGAGVGDPPERLRGSPAEQVR
ncbi:hypothetical protein [Corallococcus sp. CA054B]|uniref:hypothetical protein n=1 Tax=Corallococcus sp. CA054B TaxID=2316734 RepID=UPI000EA30F11|nr:hypothetical protein [Corallococcus sp. CA054B]